jgi:DNA-binding MurR/RpiR family transcriptional regulator
MKQYYTSPGDGFRSRIRPLLPGLSRSEALVAAHVLKHTVAAADLSVYELASETGVSVASVSRFVRAAGFKSYRDFKLELVRDAAREAAVAGAGVPMPAIYRAVTTADSDEQAVEKVFRGYIRSLEDTLGSLDLKDLVRVAAKLGRSVRVLFFGIGSSANVARDAALRFSLLNRQAEAYGDPLGILLQASRLGKGSAAVGISHSGRSAMTCEALRIARARGAVTVGISNYPRSPLSRHSDHFFCTTFPEDRVGVAALSSRIAQICVIDSLYLLVARKPAQSWDIEGLNRMAERMLRVKGGK